MIVSRGEGREMEWGRSRKQRQGQAWWGKGEKKDKGKGSREFSAEVRQSRALNGREG